VSELAQKLGVEWKIVRRVALLADPYIAHRYARPVHKSGSRCRCGTASLKILQHFVSCTSEKWVTPRRVPPLRTRGEKDVGLLKDSGKDLDLLWGVYGKDIWGKLRKRVVVTGAAGSIGFHLSRILPPWRGVQRGGHRHNRWLLAIRGYKREHSTRSLKKLFRLFGSTKINMREVLGT
jgi:hypothetical protein